jgi:hypothetical protein
MLRVRTLMIVVGIVALLLWGSMMGLRSYVYYRLASDYTFQERTWRECAARDRADPKSQRTVAAVWGNQTADFYAPLARKYRRAMWRPWEPVAPDPPAPVFGGAD